MSNSDSAHLEELRLARDVITAALVSGDRTVEYVIRGRKHRTEKLTEALANIEDEIERYEKKVAQAASSSASKRFSLGALGFPVGRG